MFGNTTLFRTLGFKKPITLSFIESMPLGLVLEIKGILEQVLQVYAEKTFGNTTHQPILGLKRHCGLYD